jgi:hypothetical protein
MWFAALAAGLCLVIVVLTPGGPRRLWRAPLLSWWMLALGVAIQVAVAFVDFPTDRIDDVGFALLMASYALLLAFCFVNIRLPGMWVIAIGLALNTVVVGLNQGMPTADAEQTTVTGRTVDRPIERTVKQRPESDDDILGFLGDVIELPGPLDSTISIGDILIVAGSLYLCVRVTRRPKDAAAAPAFEVATPRPEGEYEGFWAGEPGGEATGEMPVVVDAPDADAQLAALESAPLPIFDDGSPDIDPELAPVLTPKPAPGPAPAPRPTTSEPEVGAERPPGAEDEPAAISWSDEPVEAPVVEDRPPVVFLGKVDAAPAEDDIFFGDDATPAPVTDPVTDPVRDPVTDDDRSSSISFDGDELERKLSASENDPTIRERDRAPLVVPPAPAAPAPDPVPPQPVPPIPPVEPAPLVERPEPEAAAPPTPEPAASAVAPPPEPAPPEHAATPAPPPEPARDVSDDPLAVELEKLFAKLSRGPGEGAG